MLPRFVGRLGVADVVTVANAVVGFLAVVLAFVDVRLAARVVLLAAVLDGLDGVLARQFGGTPVGPHLDSLADVASFGVAPAALVFVVATPDGLEATPLGLAAIGVPALFVAMAVVRLGFYMLNDSERPQTEGVQTTLAGTLIAVAYLAGVTDPVVLLAGAAVLTYLMVASITYPELYARDAVVLGGLQALVVLFPTAGGRVLPRALLVFALLYLLFAPAFYWRETERS